LKKQRIARKAKKKFFRFLFANRILFKAFLILMLGFSLSGCALLGLILKLAPLAAAVLVEYSPPAQTEDGQILCVKAQRHIERAAGQTQIVKSEYFFVILDNNGTETAFVPLDFSSEYLDAEEFVITKSGKEEFLLSLSNDNFKKDWQFEVKEFSILSHKTPQ